LNTCYSAPISLTSHRRGAQVHGTHRAALHIPAFITISFLLSKLLHQSTVFKAELTSQ